jgi:excisionase family DNA binding protein
MSAPAPLPPTRTNTVPLAVPPVEAGRLLSFSTGKIYALMRTGELASFMDGRSRRITVESIKNYIARQLAKADDGDTRWQHAPPIRRGWTSDAGAERKSDKSSPPSD